MNITSYEYDADIDEFDKSGLTRVASIKVKPAGCGGIAGADGVPAASVSLHHGSGPSAGNYIIGEIVYATVDESVLTPTACRTTTSSTSSGAWAPTCTLRVTPASLFDIAAPPRLPDDAEICRPFSVAAAVRAGQHSGAQARVDRGRR